MPSTSGVAFPEKRDHSVVIAFDVRRFHNLRDTYPAEISNPVDGLSSQDLAATAARVYAAAGIRVYTLAPDSTERFISTPELSLLIRWLGAQGGMNVSASHNHPDDNGSKFYNHEGGQEVPPDDEELATIVVQISEVRVPDCSPDQIAQMVLEVPEAARQAYIDSNVALPLMRNGANAVIAFTSLHGVGVDTVCRCLEAKGFQRDKQLFLVDKQCEYRSDFRHVMFRSPNPEVPETLAMGIERAREVGAEMLLATDPDADRLGGVARDGEDYAFLTGNQIASILTSCRIDTLRRNGRLPERPLAIKTVVTTELVRRIVEASGGVVVGDLLVGFKYIANVLGSLEKTGRFGDLTGSLDDFVIAAEESHGFMLTPDIRDKDAAGAALVLAELAAEQRSQGKCVYDYLVDIYLQHGYHSNTVRSTVMQGAAGAEAIRRIQQLLRERPPTAIGGLAVQDVNDYWDEARHGPFLSDTDRSARNLISYTLEGGIKATIRPSGTEPKNKVYVELAAEPIGREGVGRVAFEEHRRQVDREVKEFSNRFLSEMLALIDIKVPEYAFEVSELSGPEVEGALLRRVPAPSSSVVRTRSLAGQDDDGSVSTWIDESLRRYGPDARALVRRGFASYAAGCPASRRLDNTAPDLRSLTSKGGIFAVEPAYLYRRRLAALTLPTPFRRIGRTRRCSALTALTET